MSDFCPKCGTQLRDGAGFCVKCGYKLVKKENTITAPKEKNKKKKNVSEIDNQVVNSVVADETKIDSIQKIEQNKRPEEHEKLFNESVSEDIKAEKEYVEKPVDNQRVSVEKKTAKDIDDALSSVGDAHAMGNKNSSKSIIIIAIVALLLGVGGFCYFKIIQPKTNYEKALTLIKESRYLEAVTILENLRDYKDSKELLAKYIEKTYLSKDQVDDLAANRFDAFISEFNTHFSQNLHAYLPRCLASKEVSNHEYEYYYLYFYGSDNDKTSLKGVTRIVVKTLPKGEYEINVDDYVNYPVNLKNVHKSEMHIRDYPDEKWGNKSGKVAIGSKVQIYAVYYINHSSDEYIWYCISSDGYTRWVADGINKSSNYYVFDNGASTKEIVFIR